MTTWMVVTTPVRAIRSNATTEEAAKLMRYGRVEDLVVVHAAEPRVPVGRITGNHIATEVIGQGLRPADVPVANVMGALSLAVREGDSLLRVLRQMVEIGMRRAPVLDRNGHIRGMLVIDGAAIAPPPGLDATAIGENHRTGPAFAAPDVPVRLSLPARERLSSRECQVMQSLLAGKNLKELACEMRLSPNTVSTYRKRLLTKLQVANNDELLLLALKEQRAGLVPDNPGSAYIASGLELQRLFDSRSPEAAHA